MKNKNSILPLFLAFFIALVLVIPAATYSKEYNGQDKIISEIQNEAVDEYIRTNPEAAKDRLEAYAVKIADGVYIADVAQVKKNDGTPVAGTSVKNLATYKIRIDASIHDRVFGPASIQEKLLALETRHLQFSNDESFNLSANRLSFDIIGELTANGPDASTKYDNMLNFIKSRKLPGASAYAGLVKNLRDKLKYDLTASQQKEKPAEVIELIKGCFEKTEGLYKSINAMAFSGPVSKNSGSNVGPGSPDSIKPYVEFLKNQNTPPLDYVMGLFEKYDIVILCERFHTETTQYDMLLDIVGDKRFIEKVGIVFTEVGSVTIRDKMNKFLTEKNLDDGQIEKQALDIYRNLTWFPIWEKPNFLEFIKKVHKLNRKISGDKRIAIYPCDMSVDWDTMTPEKYEAFNSTLEKRDEFMARNVIDTLKKLEKSGAKRKKALVIMNYRHAFNDQFKYPNGQPADNTGRYIFEAFPGKVANVMINSVALLPGTTDQQTVDAPIQNGKWDAAFKAAGNKNAGFNFDGSPFGSDAFDYFSFYPHPYRYQNIFTGYIFYKPLEEHIQMMGINGLLDDGYDSIIEKRCVNSGYKPEEAAAYIDQFKKDGVKTFKYEKLADYKKLIEQWLK